MHCIYELSNYFYGVREYNSNLEIYRSTSINNLFDSSNLICSRSFTGYCSQSLIRFINGEFYCFFFNTFLNSLGVFKFDIVDGVLDVSDCLDPESPQGQQLINFFLECRADTLPSGFRQEVIAFIKELAFEDQGRPVIFHPVGVFSIYKPDSERDGCD